MLSVKLITFNLRMPNQIKFNKTIYHNAYPLIGDFMKHLKIESLIVFDLETSALLKQRNSGIMEIALLRILNNGDACMIDTLVNPENPISLYTMNLTGISNADVIDQPNWLALIKKIGIKWMNQTLCGFGINGFDIHYLEHQNQRYGIECPINKNTIDVRKICRSLNQTNKGTLLDYAARYGVEPTGAHRAKADTLMTAGLLEKLLEKQGFDQIRETSGFVSLSDNHEHVALVEP